MTSKHLIHLRQQAKLSQDELARRVGLSRSTYIRIETGIKSPTTKELEAIAQQLGVEAGSLLSPEPPRSGSTEVSNIHPKLKKTTSPRPPINFNGQKLKNLILYLVGQIGGRPNVGETVLYKLIYFIDFDYYEKYGLSITGNKYIKNNYGPTPGGKWQTIIEEMKTNNELQIITTRFYDKNQRKYITNLEPRLDIFNGQEITHIDQVIQKLGHKTAAEISNYAHQDIPWIVTKDKQEINYQFAKYRTAATSVSDS